jgi:hypothetical protein
MTTLEQISTSDWSMALDTSYGGQDGIGLGEVVQGLDDVIQCMRIILSTPKGTDPLRPDFACDIFRFLDLPLDLVIPQIVKEVAESIGRFETRAKVLSVLAQHNEIGQLAVTLTWQPAIQGLSGRSLTTLVTIGG